ATVGFVKFRGSDALVTEQGLERTAEVLDTLATLIEASAADEGVTLLATDIDRDGGKFILAAGGPSALHDCHGRPPRFARRILDEHSGPLTLQAGVPRGHVFAGTIGVEHRATYTVMGDTVNVAARMMSAAPPGTIYTSPAVLESSRTVFETTAVAPFAVKGK